MPRIRPDNVWQHGLPGSWCRAFPLTSLEQRLHELLGGKRPQVVNGFAGADETQGDRFVSRDRRDSAGLGSAVELGEDEARHAKRGVESLDLMDHVLAIVRV